MCCDGAHISLPLCLLVQQLGEDGTWHSVGQPRTGTWGRGGGVNLVSVTVTEEPSSGETRAVTTHQLSRSTVKSMFWRGAHLR